MKSCVKNTTKKTSNYQPATSNSHGFTLIEMIVSITLFAIVVVMAFDAMGNIGIMRTRVSSRLDLGTELYGATEKFIDIIKTGGDIDYEEYWNRLAIGTSVSSGHYDKFSGFGNYGSGGSLGVYGDGLYYCISGNGTQMGSGGCLTGFNTYSGSTLGKPQRFGQYRQQFIDYNSNANNDTGSGGLGDEDGNGSIRGDDDDEEIAVGPSAFSGGASMKELYLIKKGTKSERTYLRWTLKQDPNGPASNPCVLSGAFMGSGDCIGNIQMLKMIGKDLGIAHSGSSAGKFDGIIDTWECRDDFNCSASNIPSSINEGWVDVFPDWINVKSLDFYPFPEKDFRYAWKESNDAFVLNSYVRLKITLGLSWERRRKLKSPPADITVATTINLSR